MTGGDRTRDDQTHNLALYRLSYGHREWRAAKESNPARSDLESNLGASPQLVKWKRVRELNPGAQVQSLLPSRSVNPLWNGGPYRC